MNEPLGVEKTGEAFLWQANGIADDAVMDLLILSELDIDAFHIIEDEISFRLSRVKEKE